VTNTPARDRHIGFCFQDYAPFRHLSLRENVAYGLKVQHVARAQRREQVDELLRLVRLEEFASSIPPVVGRTASAHGARARARHQTRRVVTRRTFAALDAQVRAELRSWVIRSSRNSVSQPSWSPTTRWRRWRSPTVS